MCPSGSASTRVGFIPCDQAVDVASVEPLEDQAAPILRVRGALLRKCACRRASHRGPTAIVSLW
jgi:hypothetical protein